MLLRPYRGGNGFRDLTIHRDGCIRADQCTDCTPRAAVLERVRGVVARWGEPLHVQFHDLLWTGADAKLTTFAVGIADFNPTFCRHRSPYLR